MSLSLRNLDDLHQLCIQYNIVDNVIPTGRSSQTPTGKKALKKDYVLALRNYFLNQEFPDGNLPEYLKTILTIESPMLANRLQNKDEAEVKEIWESDEWGFQFKYDGVRMLIVYNKNEGLHFFSRNISLLNYRFAKYTNIYLPNINTDIIAQHVDSFILDTEIICTNPNISTIMGSRGVKTDTQLSAVSALLGLNDEDSIAVQIRENAPLQFHAFDSLYFNGEWLTASGLKLPQSQRDLVTKAIVNILISAGMNIMGTEYVYGSERKKEFYKYVMDNKGEGVIAKNRNGLYYPEDNRTKVSWIKLKRTVSGSLLAKPLNDLVDAFIVGFDRGKSGSQYQNYVGTLKFAVNLQKQDGTVLEHIIAMCGGISFAERQNATIYDASTDTVSLNLSWYGKVAEIDGQNISPRSKTIRNARIIRWRADKTQYECNFDETSLNSLIF